MAHVTASYRPVSNYGASFPPGLANERVALHIDGMAQAFRARLLEVSVTAQKPSKWKWGISELGLEIMYGYETSRESAQIQGDSALFELLSEGQS
jgi:hypothetical protein